MKTVFIYSLDDPKTNEPRYIGKAVNTKNRFSAHLKDKAQTYKTNWIKSLKKENLVPVLSVIDEVNENEWSFWEQHYIDLYKSWGFKLTNLTPGGIGIKFYTFEMRKKMSLAKLGKPSLKKGRTLEEMCGVERSKEIRRQSGLVRKGKTYKEILGVEKAIEAKEKQRKVRNGKTYEELFGKEKSSEIREKQSKAIHPSHPAWNKGVKMSEEHKVKIRKSVESKMTEERKQYLSEKVLTTLDKKKKSGFKFYNEKPVQQIDRKTGEVIKIWSNCREAGKIFNQLNGNNISDCARQNKLGGNHSSCGYKWLYLE